MNIIFDDQLDTVSDRYTVLELDTFDLMPMNETKTAYCVIETIPITEINAIDRFSKLHQELMDNYRKRNWNFCFQALEHLQGRWNGEIDSFYKEMFVRIKRLETEQLSDSWTGHITKHTVAAE